MLGPPSAGTIGGPWEEGGSQPNPPPHRPFVPPSPPLYARMPACHGRRFKGERPIGVATGLQRANHQGLVPTPPPSNASLPVPCAQAIPLVLAQLRANQPIVDPNVKECSLRISDAAAQRLGTALAADSVTAVVRDAPWAAPPAARRSAPAHFLAARAPDFPVNAAQRAQYAGVRAALPAARHREAILEAFASHRVIVLSGATGCGKTTQVPQYLLDSGLLPATAPNVICTQPRRIAAVTVAQRVAAERGQPVGKEVGYTVRFQKAVCPGASVHGFGDDCSIGAALLLLLLF